MNQEYILEEAALSLHVGETTRKVQCPYCFAEDGGVLLTRNETYISFTCFHASCPSRSTKIINTGGRAPTVTTNRHKFIPKVYSGCKTNVIHKTLDILQNKTGLSKDEVKINHIGYDKNKDRYVFPLYTYRGLPYGTLLRSYSGGKPKAIILKHEYVQDNLAYPLNNINNRVDNKLIVIVEDLVSAIKVSRHLPCVALLGTGIGKDTLYALRGRYEDVVLWLDYDVWLPPKTADKFWMPLPRTIKQKAEIYFKSFKLWQTTLDPKDLSDNDLEVECSRIEYIMHR